ncbi:MAG: 4'-phosphopantetheinyl transferase family protein [Synechococcus sp.]
MLLLLNCSSGMPSFWRDRITSFLAPAERQRLASFRFPKDRERFLVARGGMRLLLASWRREPLGAVVIETGPQGKPLCPGGPEFNLSHAGDLILIGLHRHRPVGVDVEFRFPEEEWRSIAELVLSAEECQALNLLPKEKQREAFLASWCRLEARLKARGTGLSGLGRLHAEPSPRNVAGREEIWDLILPPGYSGAAACTGVS